EICEVRTADRLATSVEAAAKAGATGLMMLETPLLLDLRRQIVDLAAKLRLAAIYHNREFVEAAVLLSDGAGRRQVYRSASERADKIRNGEKPSDTPVEQPTKFEFVINLRSAKALGREVPPTLLAIADEVIE